MHSTLIKLIKSKIDIFNGKYWQPLFFLLTIRKVKSSFKTLRKISKFLDDEIRDYQAL